MQQKSQPTVPKSQLKPHSLIYDIFQAFSSQLQPHIPHHNIDMLPDLWTQISPTIDSQHRTTATTATKR